MSDFLGVQGLPNYSSLLHPVVMFVAVGGLVFLFLML